MCDRNVSVPALSPGVLTHTVHGRRASAEHLAELPAASAAGAGAAGRQEVDREVPTAAGKAAQATDSPLRWRRDTVSNAFYRRRLLQQIRDIFQKSVQSL